MQQNIQNTEQLIEFINLFIYRQKPFSSNKNKLFYIKQACSFLGNPQDSFKSIHITGSKGKGSTAYILNEVLIQAKYNVGLFTSPHIESYLERIQYNKKFAEEKIIINSCNKIIDLINLNKIKIEHFSFFDIFTILAFDYFKIKKVDYAIIEVGIGGRLDSTNIINPICSLITKLEIEHSHILGNTIEQITQEKGGIIKKHTPVFINNNKKQANNILKKIAKKNNSKIVFNRKETKIKNLVIKDNKLNFTINYENKKLECIINMPAVQQARNSSFVYLVVKHMFKNITDNQFKIALENYSLKCRFEVLKFKNKQIILDMAHTIFSIKYLVKNLKKVTQNNQNTLIFSCSYDKKIDQIASNLSKHFDTIIITNMNSIKPIEKEKIISCFNKHTTTIFIEDYKKAFNHALQTKNHIITVCGSVFFNL